MHMVQCSAAFAARHLCLMHLASLCARSLQGQRKMFASWSSNLPTACTTCEHWRNFSHFSRWFADLLPSIVLILTTEFACQFWPWHSSAVVTNLPPFKMGKVLQKVLRIMRASLKTQVVPSELGHTTIVTEDVCCGPKTHACLSSQENIKTKSDQFTAVAAPFNFAGAHAVLKTAKDCLGLS